MPSGMLLIVFTSCLVLLVVPAEGWGLGMLDLGEHVLRALGTIRRQPNGSAMSCILGLCEKYFYSEKQVVGSLLMVHVQNASTPFHDSLMKWLMESNRYAVLMNQRSSCGTNCYFKSFEQTSNYLVAFADLQGVTTALRNWRKLPTWNSLAKFVAISMRKVHRKTLRAQIQLILEVFFEVHAYNVKVVSFRLDADIIQMHTWYPYEGNNCADGVRNIHLIDECHYSDHRKGPQYMLRLQPLKPVIPNNLHGCPLRIAGSAYEPFSYYDSSRQGFYGGIEVHLVYGIARALEMTPVFIRINETRDNRIISTSTGIYSTLLQR